MAAGYFFTGEQDLTPEGVDRKRALLNALRKDNLSAAPVGHWTQALSRVVGSAADTMEEGQLNRTEKGQTEKAKAELMKVLGLGGAVSPGEPTAAVGATASAPAAAPAGNPSEIGGKLVADLQRDFGLKPEQAAGVVGNLAHESGNFRTLQEIKPMVPGSRGGFGYAQWTGPRRIAFEHYAHQNGLDPTSYEANYGFLKHELQNTGEGRVLNALRTAGDVNTATQIFSNQFLRPGIPAMESRLRLAGQYAGGGADMPAQGAQTAEQAMQRPAPGQFAIPSQIPPAAQAPNAQALMAALSNPWAARSPALMQLAASVAGKQLGRDPVEDMKNRLQLQQMMRDANMPKLITVKENGEEVTRVWNPATNTADPIPTSGQGAIGQPKISREIETRRAEAVKMGLDPNEGRTKQYILTGQYPKDPELTATDKNAILEADQMVSDNRRAIAGLEKAKTLSKEAFGFPGASAAATVGSVLGNETARKTQELNQVVTEQALGSLKTIFGGNPTEGERKILLEIQGSSSLSDPVRQKIFDRAIEAANARLRFNEERARQLRGGAYYKPQQGQPSNSGKSDPLGIR